jgi:hypothetical protein
MATVPKPVAVEYHEYHVDAELLSGEFTRPLAHKIDKQTFLSLEGENDSYFFQEAKRFNANGLVSFDSGYTRVAGSKSPDHGWVTLATAVVEGLNILDVITADRLVAQVSTTHPPFGGHVPSVTFLGTRFENLRVGGALVEPKMALDICGTKPAHDRLYSEDSGFVGRVERQTKDIKDMGLPASLGDQYDNRLKHIAKVRKSSKGKGYQSTLKCSVVKSTGAVASTKSFGNILQIPDLGFVSLGVLEVEETWSEDGGEPKGGVTTYFDLTMIEIEMGSIAEGTIQVANVGANGKTKP